MKGVRVDEPSYSLDAKGQLTPLTSASAELLGLQEGTWTLCPTGPDQLLFLRTPVDGRAGSPGRVVLSGDLSGFPIADLLAFMGQSRFSGTLRVVTPAATRSVVLVDGSVRDASSDDPRDALSAAIVRLGHLEESRMAEVLARTPGARVGRHLVEQGALQPHELFACVTHQVSGIFEAIMLSREGTFLVLDTTAVEKGAHALQLSTQSLLMDAIRKVDELNHYRRRIPHARVYLTPLLSPEKPLEEPEGALWASANGAQTLAELARTLHLSEFDAISAAHRLLTRGLVRISEGPHGASTASISYATPLPEPATVRKGAGQPPPPADAEAVIAIFNAIFAEAFAEVARHGRGGDFLKSANAALAHQASASGAGLLASLQFTAAGQLPADRLLGALAAGGEVDPAASVQRLRRSLSDVMFFLLFQAGELLESQADEKLAHRVKALLGKLDP